MANLEDTIRSAAPGGSIAKPLMLALLALLASGALFRGGSKGPTASTSSPPTPDEGTGGLLGGRVIGQTTEGWSGQCGQFLGRFRSESADVA